MVKKLKRADALIGKMFQIADKHKCDIFVVMYTTLKLARTANVKSDAETSKLLRSTLAGEKKLYEKDAGAYRKKLEKELDLARG